MTVKLEIIDASGKVIFVTEDLNVFSKKNFLVISSIVTEDDKVVSDKKFLRLTTNKNRLVLS